MSRKVGDGRLSREQIRAVNRAIKAADQAVDPVQPASAVLNWIRLNRPAVFQAWSQSVSTESQLAYIRAPGRRARPSGLSLKRRRQAAERTRRVLAEGVRQGARIGAEIERSRMGALSKWWLVENGEPGSDPGRSWVFGPIGVAARWGAIVGIALSIGALLFRFELTIAAVGLGFSIGLCGWAWKSFVDQRAERDERPVGARAVPPSTGSIVTQIEYLRADGRIEVAELLRPAERP